MPYPLSRDEHAAMTRYVSGIKKQLEEAASLFTERYGKHSRIAESAIQTLVFAITLEHELMTLTDDTELMAESSENAIANSNGA